MITTGMFITLVVTDVLILLYAFIDSENRNYTHIFASVIVIILSMMLGLYLQTGLVEEPGDTSWTVVTDPAVGYFFIFIGVLAIIYTLLSGLEAMHDAAQGSVGDGEEQ